MELQLEEIHKQQRQSWNRFSPDWNKWDHLSTDFLKPMNDEIIRLLNLKETDTMLDVASGTDEPGLTSAAKLKGGRVIIANHSEEALEKVRENAIRRGINNIDTYVCDVSALPFANNTFDAISCRLGFMFFPYILSAAREMVRVLKPGGKMVASVWNIPEKNFWAKAIIETINKNMDLPAPAYGAPGMFRCAKDGYMSSLFHHTGLKNISVREVEGNMHCKTPDAYWTLTQEMGTPIVAALNTAGGAMKEKIKREVDQILSQKYADADMVIDSSALVIYGEK